MGLVGIASVVFAATGGRARRMATGWFGVFTVIYAIRLVVRVDALDNIVGIGTTAASFVSAGITYLILGPVLAATADILGPAGRLMRRAWQAAFVYGFAALAIDIVRDEPGSMLALNLPAVVAAFTAVFFELARALRAARRTRGVWAALAGFMLFFLTACYETYAGATNRPVPIRLEPLGMLAFIAGLGYLVAERVIASERQLLAMSQEMDTARRIQRSILPGGVPAVPGLALGARLLPMSAVAGDFFDFLRTPDGALGVLVADVSGHGVPAAIIASMVKIAFAAQADHARDPGVLMARINRTLCGNFEQAYVTAAYACLDPGSGTVAYASAGHPPPLLRRATGEVIRLDEHELVLGFTSDVRYSAGRAPFEAGDMLLLYTDGIAEVERPDGEFFGDRQLAAWFARQDPAELPARIVDRLLADLRAWKGTGAEFDDDVTVIVVRRA